MAEYLSLEDAAQKLGIPTDKLVDLRSQGEVRGFRDGASWKFPENEIMRLADEMGVDLGGAAGAVADAAEEAIDDGFGSGILIDEAGIGSGISKSSGMVIGGDAPADDAASSDLQIGGEAVKPGSSGGSDVNLVADVGQGSDVALVATDSSIAMEDENTQDSAEDLLLADDNNLPEIDSKELRLDDPAILHDSDDEIDLGLVAQEGSTGPSIDGGGGSTGPKVDGSESSLDIGAEPEDDLSLSPDSDLSFTGTLPDEDSDEVLIGGDDEDSGLDALASDVMGSGPSASGSRAGASSLELMDELDGPGSSSSSPSALQGSAGADVLSELDLLSADSGGSGLISGDSGNLLASSGLGSSLGEDVLSGMDDALDDDDDLVIADDDDDLVIDSSGTDISVAGDSGINLMSPSDSGLSLESEPLDLAGSSISALDLGAELGSDPSGVEQGAGSDASGSMVDFQADEEFQLSPSGVGLEADFESGSQVIEVEDSEAIGEAVEFADVEDAPVSDAFATDDGGGGFAEAEATEVAADDGADAGLGLETTSSRRTTAVPTPAGVGAYEVPFNLLQCLALLSIIAVLTLSGMLMTDLVRNMWAHTEPSAPVSSLTNALIDLAGLNP